MRTHAEAQAAYEQRMAREATGMTGNPTAKAAAPYRDMHETKEFMPAVVEMAKRFGWRVYHTLDSRRCAKGFPDLVMVRDFELIFAELKSEKGVTTPEQHEWLLALGEVVESEGCSGYGEGGTGIAVHMWRPEHWWSGEIERVLK